MRALGFFSASVASLALLASGSVIAACGSSSDSKTFGQDGPNGGGGGNDSPGTFGGDGTTEGESSGSACDKMDLVFVIDDSGSMAEEQDNLGKNFPEFIKVLDQFKASNGKEIDYRIAVTTTGRDISVQPPLGFPISMKGDNGVFRQKPACGMTKRWLTRGEGDVSKAFSCVAKVGTTGPSVEMPLYATKLALGPRVADGTNAGFLRPDALLAIVVLTDEDDCSREDSTIKASGIDACDRSSPAIKNPQEYVAFLDSVTGDRGRWATAIIAGDKDCESVFGSAVEGKRLKEFVAKAGKNAKLSSICAGDLAGALKDAMLTFDAACKSFPPVK